MRPESRRCWIGRYRSDRAEGRIVAEAHLKDVLAKIADLRAMERALTDTVARCAEGTGSHCPLIEALSQDKRSDADPG